MEETHKTIPQACIEEIRHIAILYNFKRIDGVVELLRDRMFLIFVSDAPAEQRIEKLVEAYLDLTTRNVIDLKAHGRPACIAKGIAQIHHKSTPAGETEEHNIQEMAIEFHHAMGDLQKATTDHTLPVACWIHFFSTRFAVDDISNESHGWMLKKKFQERLSISCCRRKCIIWFV